MSVIDLSKYGIQDVQEIVHNPSYDDIYTAELDPSLEGYERAQETELGAVNVMTGIFTGRCLQTICTIDHKHDCTTADIQSRVRTHSLTPARTTMRPVALSLFSVHTGFRCLPT